MSTPILFIDEPIPHDVTFPPIKWEIEHRLPCGCVLRSNGKGIVAISTCLREPGQKCEDKE